MYSSFGMHTVYLSERSGYLMQDTGIIEADVSLCDCRHICLAVLCKVKGVISTQCL